MKTVSTIFKFLLVLILVFILGFVGLIIYAVVTDYKPAGEELVYKSEAAALQADSLSFTLLTWNIGYGGLNREMDFFFDGGTKVRTTEEQSIENMVKISDFIRSNDTIDFILLQEVDRDSKRSYHINEYDSIAALLDGHRDSFGKNYDVFFVPKPVGEPMGKVVSGIAMFSRFNPVSTTRFSLPGDFGFPTQLFWLDRCLLVNRYPLSNGKELIIVNVHNEAFDEGNIRIAQMDYIKGFIQAEYNNGNYIIAGGDWNQCPPGFIPEFEENLVNTQQMVMEQGFLPEEWRWVYDSSTPSNRTLTAPYNMEETTTTVIDFFLISPNIEADYVKCLHLGFTNSDHNPVIVKARLR